MDNVAQVLNNLLPAPDIKAKLRQFDEPKRCSVTGEIITCGYKIQDITLKSTNEFMDIFHGTPDGYVSEAVGRLMKVQRIGNVAIY